MLFINPEYSMRYIIVDDYKYHDFKIIISDFNNNKVHASGTILNKNLPIIQTIYNENSIMFSNIIEDDYKYNFHITGPNDLDTTLQYDATIFNNVINWEKTK